MIDELKPESKILLVSLLKRFGSEKSFCWSIDEMIKEFGSTKNVVTTLFKTLVKEELVTITKEFKMRGKGRNIYLFKQPINNAIQEDVLLKKIMLSKNPVVESVLFNNFDDKVFTVGGKIKKLRSSNRLFILILLLHADKMGRVSDLSMANISKMMGGISRDRYKSQLDILLTTKLVSYKVSGLTGKAMFGKIKGKIYLNYNHLLFTINPPSISLLTIEIAHTNLGNSDSEATALLRYSQIYLTHINKKKMNNQFSWPDCLQPCVQYVDMDLIMPFFEDKVVHDQLQLLLIELASEMLSINRSNLDEVFFSPTMKALLSWEKLMPSNMLKKYSNEFEQLGGVDIGKLFRNRTSDWGGFRQNQFSEAVFSYIELIVLLIHISRKIAFRFKSLLALVEIELDDSSQIMIAPHFQHALSMHKFVVYYSSSNRYDNTEVVIDTNINKRTNGGGPKLILADNLKERLRDVLLRISNT